jgi:hypothetical protein
MVNCPPLAEVRGCPATPLIVAVKAKFCGTPLPWSVLPLVGFTLIRVTVASTVIDAVPEIFGRMVEAAVIVAVPVASGMEVASPEELRVAGAPGLMLHVTGVLPWLPSSKVATTANC